MNSSVKNIIKIITSVGVSCILLYFIPINYLKIFNEGSLIHGWWHGITISTSGLFGVVVFFGIFGIIIFGISFILSIVLFDEKRGRKVFIMASLFFNYSILIYLMWLAARM
jgi:hypothetical protein